MIQVLTYKKFHYCIKRVTLSTWQHLNCMEFNGLLNDNPSYRMIEATYFSQDCGQN